MPKCPKCGKEVYFAEKVSYHGKDWHKSCLKCGKCNKTLTAGSFSEHNGQPYCSTPCYGALFGPKGLPFAMTDNKTLEREEGAQFVYSQPDYNNSWYLELHTYTSIEPNLLTAHYRV